MPRWLLARLMLWTLLGVLAAARVGLGHGASPVVHRARASLERVGDHRRAEGGGPAARLVYHAPLKAWAEEAGAPPAAYPDRAVLTLATADSVYRIHLERNDALFAPGYVDIVVDHSGGVVAATKGLPTHCHYRGTVDGEHGSVVAVSLCGRSGAQGAAAAHGVIRLRDAALQFEPAPAGDGAGRSARDHGGDEPDGATHVVYELGTFTDSDELAEGDAGRLPRADAAHEHTSCGVPDAELHAERSASAQDRPRRATCPDESDTRFVELLIVNDHLRFLVDGEATQTHSAAIANTADTYYTPTDFIHCLRVRLVGQITFQYPISPSLITYRRCNTTDPNQPSLGPGCWQFTGTSWTQISGSGEEYDVNRILSDFQANLVNGKRNAIKSLLGTDYDVAHLFTRADLPGGIKGIASVGCLCGASCGAVDEIWSTVDGYTAQVVAHELGHNLNMLHYTGIMSASSGPSSYATYFDSDSIADVASYFNNLHGKGGRSACLAENAVSNVIWPNDTAVCGDGFLQDEERCDPGLLDDDCCNKETCALATGCSCSTLEACCTSTGTIVTSEEKKVCRPAKDAQCDTAETCQGDGSSCPTDVRDMDGKACNDFNDTASRCYAGDCIHSRATQCRLFGASVYPTIQTCSWKEDNCTWLWCALTSTEQQCVGWMFPPLDGSPCGTNKICRSGECVALPSPSPSPITSATSSPSLPPSSTPSPSRSLSPTTSPSASTSRTPTTSPSPSRSLSPTVSPSISRSPSGSTAPSSTATPSRSLSPSASTQASSSRTPTSSPSSTTAASASVAASLPPSGSASPSRSVASAPSLSASGSPASSPSGTPSSTQPQVPQASASSSAAQTPTPTSTSTAAASSTPAASSTRSPTSSSALFPDGPTSSPIHPPVLEPLPSRSPDEVGSGGGGVSASTAQDMHQLMLIVGVVAAACALVTVVTVAVVCHRQRRRQQPQWDEDLNSTNMIEMYELARTPSRMGGSGAKSFSTA